MRQGGELDLDDVAIAEVMGLAAGVQQVHRILGVVPNPTPIAIVSQGQQRQQAAPSLNHKKYDPLTKEKEKVLRIAQIRKKNIFFEIFF